jgi:hypothetical protein
MCACWPESDLSQACKLQVLLVPIRQIMLSRTGLAPLQARPDPFAKLPVSLLFFCQSFRIYHFARDVIFDRDDVLGVRCECQTPSRQNASVFEAKTNHQRVISSGLTLAKTGVVMVGMDVSELADALVVIRSHRQRHIAA